MLDRRKKARSQDRRKSARSRVLKGAKLIIGNSSVIDCVVRNLTNVGARVQITNSVHLPESLNVSFDGGCTIRPARVVWRTFKETGIEFVGTEWAA